METEMKRKGETSRFAKADKGLFVVNSSQVSASVDTVCYNEYFCTSFVF
jgi:hypothetical protein